MALGFGCATSVWAAGQQCWCLNQESLSAVTRHRPEVPGHRLPALGSLWSHHGRWWHRLPECIYGEEDSLPTSRSTWEDCLGHGTLLLPSSERRRPRSWPKAPTQGLGRGQPCEVPSLQRPQPHAQPWSESRQPGRQGQNGGGESSLGTDRGTAPCGTPGRGKPAGAEDGCVPIWAACLKLLRSTGNAGRAPGQERWGRSVLGKGCAEHLRPGPLGSGHPDQHSFTGRTLRPERQQVSPENRSAEQTLRVTQEGLPAPTRLSANLQPSMHRSPLPCSAGPQPPRGARGPDTPAQHRPHRRVHGAVGFPGGRLPPRCRRLIQGAHPA